MTLNIVKRIAKKNGLTKCENNKNTWVKTETSERYMVNGKNEIISQTNQTLTRYYKFNWLIWNFILVSHTISETRVK